MSQSSYLHTEAQWARLCGLAGSRAEVYANVLGDRSGTGGWWPLAVAMWSLWGISGCLGSGSEVRKVRGASVMGQFVVWVLGRLSKK